MMNDRMLHQLKTLLEDISPPEKKILDFGGKVIICTGDFCQLPPVLKRGHKPIWKDSLFRDSFKFFQLNTVHRQEGIL